MANVNLQENQFITSIYLTDNAGYAQGFGAIRKNPKSLISVTESASLG